MDSNVRDDSVPMDDAATEESTSSASVRSKSLSNLEASKPTQPPVEKQASDEAGFVFPKRKRRKDKLPAEKSADAALPKPLPMDVTKPSQSSKQPLFKRPTGVDPDCVHLWNARGKRSNKKAPQELMPQIVVVDKTPIFLQKLTAAQAVASGIKGWDVVLADVAQLHAEAAVSRIASFWADWKRKLRQSRSEATQKRLLTGAGATSNTTTPPSSSATSGTGEKRKCGDTPLSNQPAVKSTKNYSGAAKSGTRHAKKDHKQILWVHSTEEEKGPVDESYFFLVVSRCNKIKIDAINNDEVAHKWSPAIKGQPIYDEVNHRGKIICSNQQTVDFWVKYIELASTKVGKFKLKAWTSKEYENKNAIYSCLIPKKTCIGIEVVDIIRACLNLYDIKNSQGVVRCHTSYTMRDQQRICILEVTEQLASFFEYHSCVLSGPFGQLTFRLRSEDNGEEPIEYVIVEDENVSPVQPPVLHIARARAPSEPASLGSSVPEAEVDGLLCSPTKPSKTTISRTVSETDSVDQAIGKKFNKLGPHMPTILDTANVSNPLPSQSLME